MKATIVQENVMVHPEGECIEMGIFMRQVLGLKGSFKPQAESREFVPALGDIKPAAKRRAKAKPEMKSAGEYRSAGQLTPNEINIIKTDYNNGRPAKKTAADIGRSVACIHQTCWRMFKTGELKKRAKGK